MAFLNSTGPHMGEFLLSEAPRERSRDNVTVTQTGTKIKSGTLLGKITATGKYIPYLDTATDGSQAVAAVLYTELAAATGDVKAGVINCDAEVRKTSLVGWDANGNADLLALGIKVRT